MLPLDLDVVVTRGTIVESRHRVHAVAVDAGGRAVATCGDPDLVTWWRSCAKPFQVMPLLARGGFDDLAWGAPELALACASHGGEPEHVALADAMLRRLGLGEGDLACGPHEPLSARGARLAREGGIRIGRLHNNCSGKHAAMLAFAQASGAPTAGYARADHPVQAACLTVVSTWTGVPERRVRRAVDGCGVPVYGAPLRAMATAYARLGAAARLGDELPARVLAAVRAHPFLVGGTGRFDTILLEATGGAVFAKVGAEGVHSVTVPEAGLGLCVKVEDGALRAQHAAVLAALRQLGALPEPLPPALAEWLVGPVLDTRGEVVGHVAPRAMWDADSVMRQGAPSKAPAVAGR